jgi:hypothetical protein
VRLLVGGFSNRRLAQPGRPARKPRRRPGGFLPGTAGAARLLLPRSGRSLPLANSAPSGRRGARPSGCWRRRSCRGSATGGPSPAPCGERGRDRGRVALSTPRPSSASRRRAGSPAHRPTPGSRRACPPVRGHVAKVRMLFSRAWPSFLRPGLPRGRTLLLATPCPQCLPDSLYPYGHHAYRPSPTNCFQNPSGFGVPVLIHHQTVPRARRPEPSRVSGRAILVA